MINTFFTSDHHFGHKNILEYEKEARPFASAEEMNERLIDNWNSVVGNSDIVFHLGDFCFGKSNLDIAKRLNGKKRLVLGNHDNLPTISYLDYFEKIYGAFFWKRCILTHIPVHPNNLGSRAFLNIHGHLHSNLVTKEIDELWEVESNAGPIIIRRPFPQPIIDPNYFNVSVEQNNLTPFHADIIMERIKEIS